MQIVLVIAHERRLPENVENFLIRTLVISKNALE